MKNRKQWYIFGGLLFILAGVLIGRLIEGWELNQSSKVQAAILIKKDSEQECSDFMSGIRDYARENGILIHMNYMDDSDASDLAKVLHEEKELGSVGALLVYPEEFYAHSDVQEIDGDIPVLVVSNEQIKLRYRLKEEDILQLMEGKLDQLVVANEYQLGYSSMDAFAKAAGREKLSDIPMDYLEITAEDVSSGKYNALLSDR